MNAALLAWEIVGGIVALIIIIMVISMIPELVRYMKLKRCDTARPKISEIFAHFYYELSQTK